MNELSRWPLTPPPSKEAWVVALRRVALAQRRMADLSLGAAEPQVGGGESPRADSVALPLDTHSDPVFTSVDWRRLHFTAYRLAHGHVRPAASVHPEVETLCAEIAAYLGAER